MPLNDFFRMRNIFGGGVEENIRNDIARQMSGGFEGSGRANIPDFGFDWETPTSTMIPPRENPGYGTPPIVARKLPPSTFGNMPWETSSPVSEPEEVSALDEFKRTVMNPPTRPNATSRGQVLRSIGTGLLSALQGSTDPAMQRVPTYNAAGKVVGSRARSGWDTLGNKPFSVEEAGAIIDRPYIGKVADWKTRAGGLEKAADIEVELAGKAGLEEQRRANAAAIPERVNQGADRIRIAQAKQAADEWKIKNPEGKVYAPKGGNVTLIHPRTGEAIDTGIPTGSLSEEERIKITGEEQRKTEGVRQEGRIELEGERHKGDLEEIGARGKEARDTRATVPGGVAAGKTDEDLLPAQLKTRYQLRMNDAVRDNPTWKQWMTLDPNTGMVQIEPSTTNWLGQAKGPDQATYNAMVAYMKGTPTTKTPSKQGSTTDKPASASTSKKPAPMEKVQKNKVTGATRVVVSLDGGKTWNPKK